MTEVITSVVNNHIKSIAALRLKKNRELKQLFLVEGWKNITEALGTGYSIDTLVVDDTSSLKVSEQKIVDNVASDCKILRVSNLVMQKITDTITPQPLLAVIRYRHSEEYVSPSLGKIVVFMNNIQDPGNVGAIIRTAAAAGVNEIYCDNGCADRYSSKVIRASAGAVFKLPIVVVKNSRESLEKFKASGYSLVGTALCEDAITLWELPNMEQKVIVLGNEGEGIEPELLMLCDSKVVIPLKNNVESLNVAAAAAVIFFALADR